MIYYSILIGFLLLILIEKFTSRNSNVQSSGIEMSTAIFIFIMALNSFKSPFYFSQGNNISRNSFIIGTIKAGIIMAAALSLIDVIINRIYNIFIICPTNFDMIYTKAIYSIDTGWEPILTHSIFNSFGTYIWTFAVYVFYLC